MNVAAFLAFATVGYTSQDDAFQVWFPSKVEITQKTTKVQNAEVFSKTYTCVHQDKLYQVAITHLPEGALEKQKATELLEQARDGTKTMNRIQILDDKALYVGGNFGRSFKTVIPEGPVVLHQMFIAYDRLYHVSAVVPTGMEQAGKAYLASFSISKAPPKK